MTHHDCGSKIFICFEPNVKNHKRDVNGIKSPEPKPKPQRLHPETRALYCLKIGLKLFSSNGLFLLRTQYNFQWKDCISVDSFYLVLSEWKINKQHALPPPLRISFDTNVPCLLLEACLFATMLSNSMDCCLLYLYTG